MLLKFLNDSISPEFTNKLIKKYFLHVRYKSKILFTNSGKNTAIGD